MKRPIFVAIIGYILGIIVGLYLHISIAPFCIILIAMYMIYKNTNYKNKQRNNKLKMFSIKRYFRYLKIFINAKVIALILISAMMSNTIVLLQNQRYKKIYNELSEKENITMVGKVIGNKEEKQYYNKYKIETKLQNQKYRFYIITDKKIQLNYGDKIKLKGEYQEPEIQRNYKGFNYS